MQSGQFAVLWGGVGLLPDSLQQGIRCGGEKAQGSLRFLDYGTCKAAPNYLNTHLIHQYSDLKSVFLLAKVAQLAQHETKKKNSLQM